MFQVYVFRIKNAKHDYWRHDTCSWKSIRCEYHPKRKKPHDVRIKVDKLKYMSELLDMYRYEATKVSSKNDGEYYVSGKYAVVRYAGTHDMSTYCRGEHGNTKPEKAAAHKAKQLLKKTPMDETPTKLPNESTMNTYLYIFEFYMKMCITVD